MTTEDPVLPAAPPLRPSDAAEAERIADVFMRPNFSGPFATSTPRHVEGRTFAVPITYGAMTSPDSPEEGWTLVAEDVTVNLDTGSVERDAAQ